MDRKGLRTYNDALYYFPRRYEDRSRIFHPHELGGFPEGCLVTVRASVRKVIERPQAGRKGKILEVWATGTEESGELICIWFHTHKGMRERFDELDQAIFTGTLRYFRGIPQLVHPDVDTVANQESLHWGRVVPIYSTTEGLHQKNLREILHSVRQQSLDLVPEEIPPSIRQRVGLIPLAEAIQKIHYPDQLPTPNDSDSPQRSPEQFRLIFEELFKFQILVLREKVANQKNRAHPLRIRNRLAQSIRAQLPFVLTRAQERVLAEILSDLTQEHPMNRILQGDVGCGKTLVALLALAEAVENGFQGAIMVPTETLATQHFRVAQKIFSDLSVRVELMVGSLTARENGSNGSDCAMGK